MNVGNNIRCRMSEIAFSKITVLLREWRQKKVSEINHNAVIKDIYVEGNISAGYFIILTLANLIALSGLITNSVPVIIGAMLISPLMGPILSFGFAFITGERLIWDKSIKKISVSIALTILIAAITTYFSPLKDITSEIISRTRPNLYDLGVAFLAGTAGAVAICTKKNYLTIVPGVAIATAVIPPLSVAGFGVGTGNYNVFLGGFFLFFTNFVAIIISTCIVFYLYGFKPSIITEVDISQLKKRVASLAVILFVISIPLIYTLHQSISEVQLRNNIQRTLKKAFNKERLSSLSTFSYVKKKDDTLEINAIINTVSYMNEVEINDIEKNIKDSLNSNIKLYIEQLKVQPGGLREDTVKTLPTIAPPKQPSEVIRRSRDSIISVVRQSTEKIDRIISPSTIADFYVGFHDKTLKVSINMKIKKDSPLSEEEILWLRKIFSTDLNLPVDLSVETVPFVPLLVFNKGETSLSNDMRDALNVISDAYNKDNNINITIFASPESFFSYNKRIKFAEERINAVSTLLIENYRIPESKIAKVVDKKKAVKTPTIKVTISLNK